MIMLYTDDKGIQTVLTQQSVTRKLGVLNQNNIFITLSDSYYFSGL